jgi:hypothetical protein
MGAPRIVDHKSDTRNLRLSLGAFAWDALEEQAAREGVTVEQLVRFAVLYFLADCDSGRMAHRVSGSSLVDETDVICVAGASEDAPAADRSSG